MDRRKKVDLCYGPYRWNGDEGAKCADPTCNRNHVDHIRKLNYDETLTKFCLICMTEHDEV